MAGKRDITVYLRSVDGFSKSRKFKTLSGAQKFAQDYVGGTPELGSGYAISYDGVCRIMVSGATLKELFPKLDPPTIDKVREMVKAGKFAILVDLPRYNNRDAIVGVRTHIHGIYETLAEMKKDWNKLSPDFYDGGAYYWTPKTFKTTPPQPKVNEDDIPF